MIDNIDDNIDIVHIGIILHNNQTLRTTIQGVDPKYNDRILRFFKNTHFANGTVLIDPIFGSIIHIIGDHRNHAGNYLCDHHIVNRDQIMIYDYNDFMIL